MSGKITSRRRRHDAAVARSFQGGSSTLLEGSLEPVKMLSLYVGMTSSRITINTLGLLETEKKIIHAIPMVKHAIATNITGRVVMLTLVIVVRGR